MANSRFSDVSNLDDNTMKPPPTGKRAGKAASFPEKCPNFGGLPGKTQPRNRSGGVRKAKVHPQSAGL